MKLLLLDFMRRWWWVLAIAVLFAAGSTLAGTAMVIGPLGAFLVFFDAQRGALRALHPLPVRGREMSMAVWLAGVLLVPALCAPAMVLMALLVPLAGAPAQAPWFDLSVQISTGMGYGALCFLAATRFPTQPATRLSEQVVQGLAGLVWGLSIPGVIFLVPRLPHTPEQLASWHWVVFALTPILVVFSFARAGEMLRSRTAIAVQNTRSAAAERPGTGLTGVPLFLARVPLSVAVILLLLAVTQVVFFTFIQGGKSLQVPYIAAVQAGMFGLIASALAGEVVGMRSLRALPLSTLQLTALLLTAPLAAAIVAGTVATVAEALATSPRVEIPPLGLASLVAGLGAVLTAINLQLRAVGKIVLLFALSIILPLSTMSLKSLPLHLFAPIGLAVFVGGAILLHATLRRSSRVYEARPIWSWMRPGAR